VLPTIRSRTQHLEFRLIGGETLSNLLHDVQGAAGLAADDALIDAAVRLGRGSARDALSALDQLIATGSLSETQPEFDGLFHALVHADAVEALRSLALLTREGWDPEQLAESFAAEVRQVFLLQAAPDVADAVDADRDRLSVWGSQLGLARTVRILETIGRAMREMKSAPDKMVMLEVALVRLIKPELDSSIEALDERVTKIERAGARPVAAPSSTAGLALRPIGSTGGAPPVSPTVGPAATVAPAPPSPSPSPSPGSGSGRTASDAAALSLEDVRERFEQRVVPRTARSAQLLLKNARVSSFDGQRLSIALPNEEMRQNTEHIGQGLRSAMEHEFKVNFQIDWIVDPSLVVGSSAPSSRPARPEPPERSGADEDPDGDESSIVVDSMAGHLISEMFPGAEEIS
jgi:DNA polymerase-3 subunit gamma/tau